MSGTLTAPAAGEVTGEVTGLTFDPAHTLIEFSAKHMMFTTVKGQFGSFTGEVVLDGQHPERSRVEVEIDAASLDTRTPMRDDHLRSADFLHVEEHPTITFRSTRVELPPGAAVEPGLSFKVAGDLTIRGVTREVVLDATWAGEGVGPRGGKVSAFSASTRINRKDWGLTWNVALETGGVLVGDEIRIEIEAELTPRVGASDGAGS
jgi:polyisoprenoid-binding protein YceI